MQPSSSQPHQGDVLRIFGPPGTGKTTTLARHTAAVVKQDGPEAIMISSFSRTAAKEVASRFKGGTGGPSRHMIGTLHSHALRAMGRPNVALDVKIIADWNDQNEPHLRITGDTRAIGGTESGGGFVSDPEHAVTGDELLGAMDRLRAALVPAEDWPINVREFADRFEPWKRSVGAVDYTDMIMGALAAARDGQPPPGNPKYFVSDEAQDMTPLEFELSRAWGSLCEKWVIAGDDDQAINRWRGGDPEPLLNLHGPNVEDRVLDRSHRVPESVRAAAEKWVRRLSHRQEKVYSSRVDDDGRIVMGAAFHVPQKLAGPDLVTRVVADLDQGRTVMVLAACNYMLEPLITNLREAGVPFHNPFRPADARWNPLGVKRETEDAPQITTAQRIGRYLALEHRDWTGGDIQSWMGLVKLADAGMLPGSKTAASRFPPNAPVEYEDLAALFATQEALELATEPSLEWLASSLLAARRKAAVYPLEVARRHGGGALEAEPRLVVGTIHSVKGAAADIVYLSPDVSSAAARSMTTRAGVDEAIRQYYVGMTRAYRELRILTPGSRNALKPSELIHPTMEVLPT